MENPTSILSVRDYFGEIEDPRLDRNKKHLLSEVLFIGLCTILVGGENFSEMEVFGLAKEKRLKQYLELPYGIPFHDTFRRVFCLLRRGSFNDAFIRWTQQVWEASDGEVVAIDGKSLRRLGKTKENIVHVVSAWAATNRLVLGQLKVFGKSNEITAIPELLRMLELEGCIVTLDAMGTQKNIAKVIHEADAG